MLLSSPGRLRPDALIGVLLVVLIEPSILYDSQSPIQSHMQFLPMNGGRRSTDAIDRSPVTQHLTPGWENSRAYSGPASVLALGIRVL